LQKRYYPIAVVAVALCAVAMIGYSQPPKAQEVPPRVLLDNNGGRVIFTHAAHAQDYGYECADCHHDGVEGARPLPCGSCHPAAFDENFKANHAKAFPSRDYCGRCHDTDPVPGMPAEDRPDPDMLLTRSDAFHGQCMGCHKGLDAGPYGEDSCATCHAK